ncbi:MAG: hypothetical protein K8I27_02950 [Planctomycetes bacterium]|nr:hypothetical protein [Planctomycetota bacterium]
MRLRDLPLLASSVALLSVAAATLTVALREVEPTTVVVRPHDAELRLPEPEESPPPEPAPDEEFRVVALDLNSDSGRSTFAVQRRVENPFRTGEYRWTLTFYTLDSRAGERERLEYLGSRCIEYDMGPDEMGISSKKGWSPDDIRQAVNDARARLAKDD